MAAWLLVLILPLADHEPPWAALIQLVIYLFIFLGVLVMAMLNVPYFFAGLFLALVGLFLANQTGKLRKQQKKAEADTTLEMPGKAKLRFYGSTSALAILFGGLVMFMSSAGVASYVQMQFFGKEIHVTKQQKELFANYLNADDPKERRKIRALAQFYRGGDVRWQAVLDSMDDFERKQQPTASGD